MLAGQDHPELSGYILKNLSGIVEEKGIVSLDQTSLGFRRNLGTLTAIFKNSSNSHCY